YAAGLDSSEGVGLDQSVVEVLRKETPGRWSEQVAEYASQYCNPVDLTHIALIIASLYSTKIDGEVNQAKVVAEVRNETDVSQWEMRKLGWRHFHSWTRI